MHLVKIPVEDLRAMESQGLHDEIMPYTHKNPVVRWLFWKRMEEMLYLARPAQRVLDFGGGSGVFLPSLAKNFSQVWCVDLRIDALHYVKDKFKLDNVVVVQGKENGPLPFEDSFFDIIFAGDVLEHIADSREVQREFDRILKPEGYVIISGPTENLLYKFCRKTVFWYFKKKTDHLATVYDVIQRSREIFSIEEMTTLPSRFVPGFHIYRASKTTARAVRPGNS
jgi:2-polyprenyl-3-methyl-5-hydroxy-6-metoxy-1,4-benzoquinol methylase